MSDVQRRGRLGESGRGHTKCHRNKNNTSSETQHHILQLKMEIKRRMLRQNKMPNIKLQLFIRLEYFKSNNYSETGSLPFPCNHLLDLTDLYCGLHIGILLKIRHDLVDMISDGLVIGIDVFYVKRPYRHERSLICSRSAGNAFIDLTGQEVSTQVRGHHRHMLLLVVFHVKSFPFTSRIKDRHFVNTGGYG